ncbi:MAG: rRNA maturation RNase YbeY [Christensenellales bacterium]|jgi:probable rRNA maturation factor
MLEIQNLQNELSFGEELREIIERVAQEIADEREIGPFEASVNIVDDPCIREANRTFRGMDRETDVLSFPMADVAAGEELEQNPDTGETVLGDIMISLPRAAAQAREYGHSLRREIGFLTAHGMLHLLGYDHETQEQEDEMFTAQERVLSRLNLDRDREE